MDILGPVKKQFILDNVVCTIYESGATSARPIKIYSASALSEIPKVTLGSRVKDNAAISKFMSRFYGG